MYDECLRSNVLPADGFLSFALVMLMRVDMLLFWIISVRLIFSSSVFDMVLSLKVCFGFEPTVLVVVFELTNCYCFVSSKLHTQHTTRFLIAGIVLSCWGCSDIMIDCTLVSTVKVLLWAIYSSSVYYSTRVVWCDLSHALLQQCLFNGYIIFHSIPSDGWVVILMCLTLLQQPCQTGLQCSIVLK